MKKAAFFSAAAMMLLSTVAMAQAVSGGAGAAEPATQTSKPADDLGYYSEVVTVCKLPDEQVAKLKEKIAAMRDATTAFWKDNQDKVAKLNKDLAEAIKAKEEEKVKQLQAEIKSFYDKSRQMFAEHQAAILAVLTPEQRQAWDSHNLRKFLNFRYQRITFTEEQEKKVKALCDDAAKDIGKLKDTTDYKSYGEIQSAVSAKIDEMLTPEQKDLLPRSPTSLPAK